VYIEFAMILQGAGGFCKRNRLWKRFIDRTHAGNENEALLKLPGLHGRSNDENFSSSLPQSQLL